MALLLGKLIILISFIGDYKSQMHEIIQLYLPVSVLFVLSFVLCCNCCTKHKGMLGYLFRGNDLKHSICSNIGTLFSITIFLVMGIGVGMTYGSAALLIVLLGGIVSLILARLLLKSPEYQRTFFADQSQGTSNFSIINLTGNSLDNSTKILHGLIVLGYLFCFLILEFALVRLCYRAYFPDSTLSPLIFAFFFMFICFMYTFLGGFRGILITDKYQLVIIGIATAWILILYPNSTSAIYTNFRPAVTTFFIQRPIPLWLLKCSGLFIYMICWLLASADFWIRTVCTLKKNQALAKKSITISILIMIFCSMVPILVGICFGKHCRAQNIQPMLPFCLLGDLGTTLAAWPKGLLLAALAAACYTTIDTFILASTQTYFVLSGARGTESDLSKFHILKPFSIPTLMFQIIVFFAVTCISLYLTQGTYLPFFVSFIHILFFLLFIVLCSVYFKQFYMNNIGPRGFFAALIIAVAVIVWKRSFFVKHFELTVFVDIISILIIIIFNVVIKLLLKLWALLKPNFFRTQKSTTS